MYLQKAAVVSSVVSWMRSDDKIAGILLLNEFSDFFSFAQFHFYRYINIDIIGTTCYCFIRASRK